MKSTIRTALLTGISLLAMSAVPLLGRAPAPGQKPDCTGMDNLFREKCSMCHGQDGKGYAALHTPNFTDGAWQKAHKDPELIDAVTNGKKNEGTMPPWKGKLTQEQIEGLVHCVVRGFGPKT
jgi:mono/diheme cytochrome c family protein